MGTDSREAKSLDNMQICLVAYIPQGRIWIGSLAFYLPSWEEKIFLLSSPREQESIITSSLDLFFLVSKRVHCYEYFNHL